ncbi:MAG: type II toxin-antitoxin system HicA family toxin [Thermomicrobiales bacterium]
MTAQKFPVLKGRQVIAALERAGFVIAGGAKHTKMRGPGSQIVMIPNHPGEDVKPGTLRSIMQQAGLTADEFRTLM